MRITNAIVVWLGQSVLLLIANTLAQHTIDQRAGPGLAKYACELHRFIDTGVIGRVQLCHFVQGQQQQKLQIAILVTQGFL